MLVPLPFFTSFFSPRKPSKAGLNVLESVSYNKQPGADLRRTLHESEVTAGTAFRGNSKLLSKAVLSHFNCNWLISFYLPCGYGCEA